MGLYRFIETAGVITFTLAVFLNILIQRRRGVQAVVLRLEDARESLGLFAIVGWFAAVFVHGLGIVTWAFGPRLFAGALFEVLASAFCLAGVAIGLAAYVSMGRAWRIGIDHDSDEELVTSGVFALSRNPIYLFVDLFAIASAIGTGTVFFLVTAPVILIGVHAQIRREEQYLGDVYGAAFERYCEGVGRYFGTRS